MVQKLEQTIRTNGFVQVGLHHQPAVHTALAEAVFSPVARSPKSSLMEKGLDFKCYDDYFYEVLTLWTCLFSLLSDQMDSVPESLLHAEIGQLIRAKHADKCLSRKLNSLPSHETQLLLGRRTDDKNV